MDFEKAVAVLSDELEDHRDEIEMTAVMVGFDADDLARHLLNLRNIATPDDEDIEQVLDLVVDGRFKHWACPTCFDEVYEIQIDDWGDWQGVAGTQDFSSYPGRGPGDKRCDSCRCHMVGDAEYSLEEEDER